MKSVILAVALLASTVANAGTVRLVVDFKDDATEQDVQESERDIQADLVAVSEVMWPATKLMVAEVNEADVADYIELLEDDDDVEIAELDQVYSVDGGANFTTPNDPMFDRQQWNMGMINISRAWKLSTGKGVVVAVADTGVSFGNNEGFPRVGDLRETCFVPGYNFIDDTPNPNDGHGHGSHVAGTIAQSTNNGVAGVGEAFEACIMAIKVLSDQGSGSTSQIAEGIRWAATKGSHVINLSLGGGGYSKVLDEAGAYAAKKNVILFCAAGNTPSEEVHYPSAYSWCNAISAVGPGGEVGSADASSPKTAQLATYSSYGGAGGKKGIFIAGPGGDQRRFGEAGGVGQATIVRGNPRQWAFQFFNGSSMSTPAVSGAAALVISTLMEQNDGKYKAKDVQEILASTAFDKDDKKRFGAGILDAGAAVEKAAGAGKHSLAWFLLLLVPAGAFFLLRRKV